MADPKKAWRAWYMDGRMLEFAAENRALAVDHAEQIGRFEGTSCVKVKFMRHLKPGDDVAGFGKFEETK